MQRPVGEAVPSFLASTHKELIALCSGRFFIATNLLFLACPLIPNTFLADTFVLVKGGSDGGRGMGFCGRSAENKDLKCLYDLPALHLFDRS
jgi:hypothetical protein